MSSSLREFQLRLSERIRQAAAAPMGTVRLGVRASTGNLLVDLSEVGEIVPFTGGVTPVPLTREWFRGLVNLRGSLYGISDLGLFEGGAPLVPTRATRLLAFAPRLGLNAALLVERTLGLQAMPALREITPGEDGEGGQDTNDGAAPRVVWRGRRWLDDDGERWDELSLEALSANERFLAVNR